MTNYIGDFVDNDVVYMVFNTFDSNDPSASVTITNFINTDVHIHKDDGLTQRNNAAGITVSVDFDGITGSHMIKIDTSDNTVAGFWVAGSDYFVRIEGTTVDAATINAFVGHFSIENRTGLRPTVAGRTLDVTATGAAGIDWGNVENPTTAVDLSGTDIQLCDTVTTNTDMVGTDSAALATDMAKVPKSDGTVSWNATALAAINAEADTAISDAALATATNLATVDTNVDSILVDTVDIQGRLPAALVGGLMSSDVTAISTDTTAADNLELQFDTTGLTGDTFPATQSQVNSFSAGSAAISTAASSLTVTTGTGAGVVGNTKTQNDSYHTVIDATGTIDVYYEFDIGGDGTPVSADFNGRMHGDATKWTMGVYAWDWTSSAWEQMGSFKGKTATTSVDDKDQGPFPLLVGHVGTGANKGKVRVRIFASGLTTADNPKLFTDQILVSYAVVSRTVGYALGSVWVDSTNGTAGTENYVNGTADNAVDTFADALTIAASLGLNSYFVMPNTTITLAATLTSAIVAGHGWDLALGGQSVNNCHFFDCGDVSGVGTAATEMEFHRCEVSTASVQKCHFYDCGFDGTVTFTLAGDYNVIDGVSRVAGASAPTFTKTAGQAITAQWRRWSGGITVSGLQSGDTITISGELGTVTLNGADATVEIRGTYKALTNNLTGSPTVNTDGAIKGVDVADILVDTADIQPNYATSSALATVDTNVDNLNLGIIYGTAQTGTLSTTVATTDLTGYLNDELIGRVIVFTGGTADGQASDITDYVATSGTVTYTAIPTAPANGDTFKIV